MSTKKKGLLTTSGEWAKHLRKYGKRLFWKKERAAARPMTGHFNTLTPEQQKKALEYRGKDC